MARAMMAAARTRDPRRAEESAKIKEHGNRGNGKDRGQRTDGGGAGSKQVHPPAKRDEVKRRMRVTIEMRPDLRPRRGGGNIGQIQRSGLNNAGGKMIVDRAPANGHLDGPELIHPQAGSGDVTKAQATGEEKDDGKNGQFGAGG